MRIVLTLLCPFLLGTSMLFSQMDASVPANKKCRFPIFAAEASRLTHNRMLRRAIATAPVLQTSKLSPSGHFRIHFDTSQSSNDTPARLDPLTNQPIPFTYNDYADSVAKIFDRVWEVEIGAMGFPAPPPDGGAGGGNEYDIYVKRYGGGYFGETVWDDSTQTNPGESVPRFPSYIQIDNQFGTGYRTKGMAAVRVTAAHEFFHAIQLGGYGWWGAAQAYFYELMAESLESAVSPEVRDYIFDAKDYFRSINRLSFAGQAIDPDTKQPTDLGYDRAIVGVYFRQKYSIDFIRTTWENIRSQQPLSALLAAIASKGSTMRREISEFATWCYFTGYRADSIKYFPDAKHLPLVNLADSVQLTQSSYSVSRTCASYTIHYFWLGGSADTAVCIVVNASTDDALASAGDIFRFTLDARAQTGTEWKPLLSNLNFRLSVDDPAQWNAVTLGANGWKFAGTEKPYPVPYTPGHGVLAFPITASVSDPVEVTILDASLRQIRQWQAPLQLQMGLQQVVWDGRNQQGSLVSSGIYFYFIRSNNYQQQGKIAILR